MSGNVAMSRASAEGAEYTKNIQGKKKKATFECQACTRKFATRSHLVRHSRVHTGERRYACDYPGCEMRCSRKDNLQQHYRTHLVVNPRRANAQSMLTGAGSHDMETENTSSSSQQQSTDMAHEFSSEKLTSPADLKPIITGNATLPSDPSQSQSMQATESHSMAMNGNPLHIHPALGGNLHHHGGTMTDENGPERDWSISPPPPLSSAYDYWYAHGCLPQAARNPASVSGSGSSGATSPEISNALELAPGQVPRQYVDSPTTYYHHHQAPPPSHPPPLGSAYSSYDSERQQQQQQQQQPQPPQTQHGYPLATATFPTAADYQHPATTSQSHPHHHQRSHSHSYSIGGNSSGGGGYTRLGGYQSASTSPHLPNAHLHGIHHHHHPHHPHHHQGQVPRQHSYDTTTTASTPTTATAVAVAANVANVASYATNNSNPRSLAAVQGYHAPGPNTATNNSPTDRFSQSSSFHGHPHPQSHPGHGHSHSHSAGSSHAFQPPPTAAATAANVATNGAAGQQRLPARETDGSNGQSQSRPVTRHGSISTTAGAFSMPVYPSHPHSGMTTYGVPVDMAPPLQTTPTSATAGAGAYAESPIQRHSMPVSVASSPRMQTSQQSPSLVLPPIRYADSEPHQVAHHQHSHSAYGMMSMGGGHFSSGTPWDRVNVSDARALPPQGHLANGGAMTR